MRLSGIQKLTLLDFPGHTAATVFTPGCNFRCPFCHNADLVLGERNVATCAPGPDNGGMTEPTSARASEKGETPPATDANDHAKRPLAGENGNARTPPPAGADDHARTPPAASENDHARTSLAGEGNDATADRDGATHGESSAGLFPTYDLTDFFSFLDKRKGLLDGICITGGEPLLQPGLADFCARVRERGFAIKLDTNGSFPDRLQALVGQGLVDYVAMDVKNAPERYAETVGASKPVPPHANESTRPLMDAGRASCPLDLARVRESVSFLLEGSVPYEFRTTVVRELHTESDLHSLAEWIAGAEAWFLQSFIDEESVLEGPGRFHAWEPDELRHILPELQRVVPTAALRGIDP